MKLNEGLLALENDYVFAEAARRARNYAAGHPDARLLRLGIGDARGPLAPTVVRALRRADAAQGCQKDFRGYGPVQGYGFLRQAVAAALAQSGAAVPAADVFINDGAKTDLGGILDLLAPGARVLLCDPTYPAVRDACLLRGLVPVPLPATPANNFLPGPPPAGADAVYLCSPANPTGAVYDRRALAAWVDWAHRSHALLLFDAAYSCFVADPALPRSIYALPGAGGCAVEIGSFSKSAAFTGMRCGYTVVPAALSCGGVALQTLWRRRLDSRSNGVAYSVQCGAAAALSPAGRRQNGRAVARVRQSAALLGQALDGCALARWGGRDAPYLWVRCPGGLSSWGFFDFLLAYAGIVGTPGVGFGPGGEGYFRFSAFADPAEIAAACRLLPAALARLG